MNQTPDYLIEIIRREAERPTVEELVARLKSRKPIESELSAADIIRDQRGPI